MNIKTLSVSLTALCLSAAAPAADMLLENYGSSRPTWLSKLKKLDRSSDGKFRVLQIGDSHTAGDLFTEQLRLRLRTKMGRRRHRLGLSFERQRTAQRSRPL